MNLSVVDCDIKLLDQATDQVIANGSSFAKDTYGKLIVRWVAANDTDKPITCKVDCKLKKNGNPVGIFFGVPGNITLQPKQLWTHEYVVDHTGVIGTPDEYKATIKGQLVGFGVEEDYGNNNFTSSFDFKAWPG